MTASARIGFQNGDDSYSVSVAAPLARVGAAPTPIDPRGLQAHPSFGFDVTNIIWRPRATSALRNSLGRDASTTVTPAERAAARELMIDGSGVDAPWAVLFNVSYRFSRNEYDYADAAGGATRAAHHLNDAATILLGAQLFARHGDPGVFVGVSYIYSAVFLDASAVAGTPVGAPSKLRADDVRLEMRRPFGAGRFGVAPAVTYDTDARLTSIEAAAYAFLKPTAPAQRERFYAAVRGGRKDGFGAFASVVVGARLGERY
jgi:hypothetical protein